jgi:hypothetical protein
LFPLCSHAPKRTRGDQLQFTIAFALRGARKIVRGLRHGLSESERYRVAGDVVQSLQEHGDPWRLNDDMPLADPAASGHATLGSYGPKGET